MNVKPIFKILLLAGAGAVLPIGAIQADSPAAGGGALTLRAQAEVFVQDYQRKDGTLVQAHFRSNADGNFGNNWTTLGNVNPFTGAKGSKAPKSQGDLRRAAGLSVGASGDLSAEGAKQASENIQQALTGGGITRSGAKVSPEPVDAAGSGLVTGGPDEEAVGLKASKDGTSLKSKSISVPEPEVAASGDGTQKDKVIRRYERVGKAIGSILGGTLLGGMFFAAGAPSLVGAVSAGILGGYIGVKVGGAIGKAVGQGVAKAKLWLDKQGHNLKEHLGALGRWWGNRPRWGKPYP